MFKKPIIVIISAIGRPLLNIGPNDFQIGRLEATYIQRLPATFARTSVHLVDGSPMLRLSWYVAFILELFCPIGRQFYGVNPPG